MALRRAARDHRDERGFTLIELLVVILVIGILAGIAIPIFLRQRVKGYDAQAKSDARNVANLEEGYFVDNGVYRAGDPVLTLAATQSDNVSSLDVFTYAIDGSGKSNSADQVGYYCVIARSASGNVFHYDSHAGGFAPACSP